MNELETDGRNGTSVFVGIGFAWLLKIASFLLASAVFFALALMVFSAVYDMLHGVFVPCKEMAGESCDVTGVSGYVLAAGAWLPLLAGYFVFAIYGVKVGRIPKWLIVLVSLGLPIFSPMPKFAANWLTYAAIALSLLIALFVSRLVWRN